MNSIYKIISIVIILFYTSICFGQNDTKIEYVSNDTCLNISLNEYDRLLRHIIPNKKEITHLYKVDLIQLAQQKLNFSFEHSIKQELTLEHEATFHIVSINGTHSSGFNTYYFSENKNFFTQFSKESLYYLTLNSNLKYYHNIDKRIRRGRNTNGFSGNYLSLGVKIRMAFYDTDLWHVHSDGELIPYDNYYNQPKESIVLLYLPSLNNKESMGYINFGYGLQRRIGNIGYWSAEAKVGIGTNKYFDTIYIPIELNLKAGFALSSLKRKR